jgi:hypothetical protein
MKKIAVLVVSLSLLSLSCKTPTSDASSGSTSSVSTTTTSVAVVQPKAGTWTSTTDFGTLEFDVNDSATYITKVTFNFNGWMGISGGVAVSKNPGWAIANRTFQVTATIIGAQWTIDGTFDNTGVKASGTWKAVIGGQTQTGTWQAVPKS